MDACAMPARSWREFLEVYYRPHLLVVNLGISTNAETRRKRGNLLRKLIADLPLTGDYAIAREGHKIKIAFESDLDDGLAKRLVGARRIKRGDAQWASQSICNFRL
jgi:hypothetical protein